MGSFKSKREKHEENYQALAEGKRCREAEVRGKKEIGRRTREKLLSEEND